MKETSLVIDDDVLEFENAIKGSLDTVVQGTIESVRKIWEKHKREMSTGEVVIKIRVMNSDPIIALKFVIALRKALKEADISLDFVFAVTMFYSPKNNNFRVRWIKKEDSSWVSSNKDELIDSNDFYVLGKGIHLIKVLVIK